MEQKGSYLSGTWSLFFKDLRLHSGTSKIIKEKQTMMTSQHSKQMSRSFISASKPIGSGFVWKNKSMTKNEIRLTSEICDFWTRITDGTKKS